MNQILKRIFEEASSLYLYNFRVCCFQALFRADFFSLFVRRERKREKGNLVDLQRKKMLKDLFIITFYEYDAAV